MGHSGDVAHQLHIAHDNPSRGLTESQQITISRMAAALGFFDIPNTLSPTELPSCPHFSSKN